MTDMLIRDVPDDLARFADKFSDLGDPDVVSQAWH
jgi:hypothetical protein